MAKMTTIAVSYATKRELAHFKSHPRQSYDEVLQKAIKIVRFADKVV